MPFTPKSGTTGFVKLGAATYAFGKWKLAIKGGTPPVTNFTGGGFQQIVPGVVKGTLTLSGPWDYGNMPLVVNTSYVFHLGLDTGIELVVTAQVSGIEPEDDVEDAARVTVTAESNGAFTAAIT
jgi:hypothetical protein